MTDICGIGIFIPMIIKPKIKKTSILAILLIFFLEIAGFMVSAAPAEENNSDNTKPLWEIGLIPGAIRLPHYRGSDEYNIWAMPLPYLIYRGKIMRLDQEGLRGIFYQSEYVETNISGWGNPPVDEENEAREGMPELDAIVEVGPSLKWHFLGRRPDRTLYIGWALRSAISIGLPDDMDIRYQGLKAAMSLVYRNDAPFGKEIWNIGFNTGLDMADKKYHRYFYEVPLANALPERPAYCPDEGISALFFSCRLSREINHHLSIGGYARWENMSFAAYKNSPLVEEENNFIIGCALVWTIKESKKRVGYKTK